MAATAAGALLDDTDGRGFATAGAAASGAAVARRLRLRAARRTVWFVASDPRCLGADMENLAFVVAFWEVVTETASLVVFVGDVVLGALALLAAVVVVCFFEAGAARGLGPAALGPVFELDANSASCLFFGALDGGNGELLVCFFAGFTGCCTVPWAEAEAVVSCAGFGLAADLAAGFAADREVATSAAAVGCAEEPAWWVAFAFPVCGRLPCLWPAWWGPDSVPALGRSAPA